MFLLKLQQRLKEIEAIENIKAVPETEDVITAGSHGFPFSLLGFLPLYAMSLGQMIYVEQLSSEWYCFLRVGTA